MSERRSEFRYNEAVLVRLAQSWLADDFIPFFPRSLSISRTRKQETRLAVTNTALNVQHR